jgi:hypothetical protein
MCVLCIPVESAGHPGCSCRTKGPSPISNLKLSPRNCDENAATLTPLAATLVELSVSVENKRLTKSLTPLNATLTKNRGVGSRLAHPTRMHILSPPTAEESKNSSPAVLFPRSFHSLHQECFTTLLQSNGSALFLKTAGCVPPPNIQPSNLQRYNNPLSDRLPVRKTCILRTIGASKCFSHSGVRPNYVRLGHRRRVRWASSLVVGCS